MLVQAVEWARLHEVQEGDGGAATWGDTPLPLAGDGAPLVGDEINIVQEEVWTSPTNASLEVTIPGKPGEMKGSIAIAPSPSGTVETVKVEVKVNIPLIGGKIEGFIADILVRALRAETKVGREWLAAETG